MSASADILNTASNARPSANSTTISEAAGGCSIKCVCDINTDIVSDIKPISNVTMTNKVSIILGSSNSANAIN